jgi:hypothetical protein
MKPVAVIGIGPDVILSFELTATDSTRRHKEMKTRTLLLLFATTFRWWVNALSILFRRASAGFPRCFQQGVASRLKPAEKSSSSLIPPPEGGGKQRRELKMAFHSYSSAVKPDVTISSVVDAGNESKLGSSHAGQGELGLFVIS